MVLQDLRTDRPFHCTADHIQDKETRNIFTDKYTKSGLTGVLTAALLLTAAHPAAAQFGMVFSHQKISDTEGESTGVLSDSDVVAAAMTSLGDLNGDGAIDLAAGANGDQKLRITASAGLACTSQKCNSVEGRTLLNAADASL